MCTHSAVGRARRGFTLVEMLVVIAVIGTLISLLLPAIQSARESARKATCVSNLRQVGLAMQHFENGHGYFPPSRYGAGSWSAFALIVPHLEQGQLYGAMDFNLSYSVVQLNGHPLPSYAVPVYRCPSEARTDLKKSATGVPTYVPVNYAMNMGTWMVWDPAGNGGAGIGGDGVFSPQQPGTRAQEIRDGLSNTLCVAEVKTYTDYYRGTSDPPSPTTLPATSADICTIGAAGTWKPAGSHVEWTDGKVHECGFTTVFTPNKGIACNGSSAVDYVGWSEGKTPNPSNFKTYAAVTSRSYHPGLVNVVMMDASVHPVSNDVSLSTWRAMSTRASKDYVDVDGR